MGLIMDTCVLNDEAPQAGSGSGRKERIDDLQAAEGLAVAEVFRIEGAAAEFCGGGDDGGVPVRKLIAAPEGSGGGGKDAFQGDGQHGDVAGQFEGGIDAGFGDAERSFPQGVGDEFLENLGGKAEVFTEDQGLGALLLCGIRVSRGAGVEEDIGIEEDLSGHECLPASGAASVRCWWPSCP